MNAPEAVAEPFSNSEERSRGATSRAAGPALPHVGFIVGPTASGKSSLALRVAQRLGCEIVNADSRQVYRGMDIGTAKPGADERRLVPHHLLDLRDPREPFDVAEFAKLARANIAAIAARGCPVLVVGGSGLYLRAIRGGIFSGPAASPAIRSRLKLLAEQHGVDYLFARLREVDPASAIRLDPNDFRRIARALEVYEQTGITISEHQRRHQFADRRFDSLTVGLTLPRERLYRTIDQRFDAMVEAGLVDEVRRLVDADNERRCRESKENGELKPLPLLSSIGYRELAAFLRGEIELDDAIAQAKRASRRLAKRQLTWFRADPEIVWLDAATAADEAFVLFQRFFQTGEHP